MRDQAVIAEDAAPMNVWRAAFSLFEALPSKAAARKALKRGQLLLDDEPVTWWGQQVCAGQSLTLLERPIPPGRTVYERAVEVVYEDDWLAVVNKPAGLVVNGWRPGTLENALPFNLSPSPLPDRMTWPRPVHRLDARTSGLVVVAKAAGAAVHLGRQFQERRIQKTYRAIVAGRLEGEGRIDSPIDEREAVTVYRALEHTRSLKATWTTTLHLAPETGRTHQLRRHLSGVGHSILGDQKYGDKLRGKGLFLQAIALVFAHPHDERSLRLDVAELPRFQTLRDRETRRWRKHRTEDDDA